MGEFGRWLVSVMLITVFLAGIVITKNLAPRRLSRRRGSLHGGLLIMSSAAVAVVALYDTAGVGQPLYAWEAAALCVLTALQILLLQTIRRRALRLESGDSYARRHSRGDI